jgi:hypothetical protein
MTDDSSWETQLYRQASTPSPFMLASDLGKDSKSVHLPRIYLINKGMLARLFRPTRKKAFIMKWSVLVTLFCLGCFVLTQGSKSEKDAIWVFHSEQEIHSQLILFLEGLRLIRSLFGPDPFPL